MRPPTLFGRDELLLIRDFPAELPQSADEQELIPTEECLNASSEPRWGFRPNSAIPNRIPGR